MTDLGQRIRAAREAAGLTQRQVAEHFKIKRPTVAQWESGDSRPDSSKFTSLAKLLGVTTDWLLEEIGTGPAVIARPKRVPGASIVGARDLPVYAATQGGHGHMIISFDPVDYVKRPIDLESVRGAYAILITGGSMEKAYREGDMALVNPLLGPARDEVHVFYDHDPEQATAESIIKNLISWTDRKWKLEQFNPMKKYDVDRVDWPICHRVTGKYNRR
jgi:transcriptional regulator with XRE-family HTH domain